MAFNLSIKDIAPISNSKFWLAAGRTRDPASIIIELMAGAPQGFLEFDHTADWGLHVWAGDLASLFIQSALGMNALCGIALSPAATPIRLTRAIHLSALDAETLLVSFLSELLYFEEEGLGFDEFDLVVHDNSLDGRLFGGEIVRQEIEIKAVTFHNLRVLEDDAMFQVSIVFDV